MEIITRELPDVVFTDFRMPKMSGIELMQNTKKNGVNPEFIIVSAFSDFSYVQEVLRIEDYGTFYIAKCTGITPGKFIEFENAKENILKILGEQKYTCSELLT